MLENVCSVSVWTFVILGLICYANWFAGTFVWGMFKKYKTDTSPFFSYLYCLTLWPAVLGNIYAHDKDEGN